MTDEKRQYGLATAQKWLQESNQRVEPQCRYYGRCGGCQGQHIPVEMQRKAKEKALFSRLSKLQAEPIQLNANDLWRTMGLSPSRTIKFTVEC